MNKLKRLTSGLVATFFACTLLASTASAQVQVSEFMADPDLLVLSDVRGEWVELENKDSVTVNLSGWELEINGVPHSFTGPNLDVAAGGFFVVCRIGVLNGNVDCDYTWTTMPELSDNGTSTIILRDPSDTPTDTITYNADAAGEDVSYGTSTQVIRDENGNTNFRADTENTYYQPTIPATPWSSEVVLAEDTGTPGAANTATPPAANVIEVNPNDLNGWAHSTEAAGSNGTYELENDVTSPPRGTGSLRLETPASSDHSAFMNADFNGTRLADIVSLSYATYRHSGDSAPTIALQLNFDDNLTDADEDWKGRLVYEPYHTQTVVTGAWQTWNTLTNSGSGNWWFSNGTMASTSGCTQGNPCTWQQVVAAFPEGGIHSTQGAIVLKAGSGWTNFVGNVDSLNIATAGNSANPKNTIYDFEGDKVAPVVTIDPTPATTTDRTPGLSGTVDDKTATIVVTIDGVDYIATNNGDGTWTLADNTISPLSTGVHTIKVVAEDTAGNTSTASRDIEITLLPVFPMTPSTGGGSNTNSSSQSNDNGFAPILTAVQNTQSTSPNDQPEVEAETDETDTSSTQTTNDSEADEDDDKSGFNWWWLLLVAIVLALLVAAARRRANEQE